MERFKLDISFIGVSIAYNSSGFGFENFFVSGFVTTKAEIYFESFNEIKIKNYKLKLPLFFEFKGNKSFFVIIVPLLKR